MNSWLNRVLKGRKCKKTVKPWVIVWIHASILYNISVPNTKWLQHRHHLMLNRENALFNISIICTMCSICSWKATKKKLSHHVMKALGGERKYSSYSLLISALDGGEWSASRPGCALALGKGPLVSTVQEAGWAPEPVWTQRLEEKSFCLFRGLNLGRLDVQPIARHHTDWATPAHEEATDGNNV
jgi:hypothetical protein